MLLKRQLRAVKRPLILDPGLHLTLSPMSSDLSTAESSLPRYISAKKKSECRPLRGRNMHHTLQHVLHHTLQHTLAHRLSLEGTYSSAHHSVAAVKAHHTATHTEKIHGSTM